LDFNPETRREFAGDLGGHCARSVPAYLTGYWILRVLRAHQRDPNFASLHKIGDPRVSRLLRSGNGTSKLSEREE
jgi:hypothetical protein